MEGFKIASQFKPAGDQPEAITRISDGIKKGYKDQVLLGVTGSGKTFTMANVIQKVQKPTLVIAHNKTLAAQLCSEFREFFPKNAVEYFVSYYDYYQPEAYLPTTDTYIEKEATINDEIDRLRHAATQALLTRRDVIIVASVSCIYGLGSPEEYSEVTLELHPGQKIGREEIINQLVKMQYIRNDANMTRGTFRVRGDVIDITPVNWENFYRIELFGDEIEKITLNEYLSGKLLEEPHSVFLFPAKHFVIGGEKLETALKNIESELVEQVNLFKKQKKYLEADRLERRTRYDMEMLRNVGYCSGIENYSRHLSGRPAGSAPDTLLSYFPKDFLLVIDESHITVPQIQGMYAGDKSRKDTLIDFGFRLPSARDNRPLKFDEFQTRIDQVVYTSATPADYELEKAYRETIIDCKKPYEQNMPIKEMIANCRGIIEQIIRPTGLVDPELDIRPSRDQIKDFIEESKKVVEKNERALVTTLTKKMAEDLTDYLLQEGLKVRYLHSEVETLERIEILRELREGKFDVLVGVNLLREGLDLPEVSLVAILDADKEGFLRSERSLVQTIGRAARNVSGRVILYADQITNSISKAVSETNRRRKIQQEYNKKHNITPQTIKKTIKSIVEKEITKEVSFDEIEKNLAHSSIDNLIKQKEKEMKEAARDLQFELAAILRDELIKLKKIQREKAKSFI